MSADERKDYVDAMDASNDEMGFLREIVQLLQAASFNHEACGNISLINITDDMLNRLEQVKITLQSDLQSLRERKLEYRH